MNERYQLHLGDCLEVLKTLPDGSVNCCVTSPPYWGLRDYGHDGQIGLEETPDAYVARMVEVFREVRRVLRDDGTLWLNLGDSYAATTKQSGRNDHDRPHNGEARGTYDSGTAGAKTKLRVRLDGLKPKDLVGIPWRVAFALQADGWWLRQDIIWHKPNPMPESCRDRCTKAHEYLFLLTKSPRYFWNYEAIQEPMAASSVKRLAQDVENQRGSDRVPGKTNGRMKAVGPRFGGSEYGDSTEEETRTKSGKEWKGESGTRNPRSVWTIPTQGFKEAHFATFPPALVKPCLVAGCPADGTVLDPFSGAGTTGLVALEMGNRYIGIELNPEYNEIAKRRIEAEARQKTMDFGGTNE